MNPNHTPETVIETRKLSKDYKRFEKQPGLMGSFKSLFHRTYLHKRAVADFNLSVEAGECVGLIGPNGAGKTTLVKLLSGIIAPTAGGIDVLGFEPNRLENAFKMQYAVVMGQKSQLFFELTPADTFRLFQRLYEIPEDIFRRNVEDFAALFDVRPLLNVQVRTLSLGERMKMELITALLHGPKILFLDEPTIGLDAVAQKQMRTFLYEVNRDRGITILLTSHYMEDIKQLCPRCVVIGEGRKAYDGPLDALLAAYQRARRIDIRFPLERPPAVPAGIQVLQEGPGHMALGVPMEDTRRLMLALIAQDELYDITVSEEDIGDVVARIYAAGKGA